MILYVTVYIWHWLYLTYLPTYLPYRVPMGGVVQTPPSDDVVWIFRVYVYLSRKYVMM